MLRTVKWLFAMALGLMSIFSANSSTMVAQANERQLSSSFQLLQPDGSPGVKCTTCCPGGDCC